MMLIFSAVIPQPLYAQIAAAPLDHSGGLFFSPEQQHPGVQGNYVMFPPSTYVLSPHASGWRKFQSVFLSGNYHSTDAKQTFEGSSAPAGRKDGKDTYNDGGVGSTFIINRIFFVDLNGKYSTGEYKGYTGLNEDSTLTRTAAGGNLNGGVRLWQILSLGIGYAQVNHETTFKVKGSDDYKASTSEVTDTSSGTYLLNMFYGLRFDLSVIGKLFFIPEILLVLLGRASNFKPVYYTFCAVYTVLTMAVGHVVFTSLYVFKIYGRHITFEYTAFFHEFASVFRESVTTQAHIFFPAVGLLCLMGYGSYRLWREFYPLPFGSYKFHIPWAVLLFAVGLLIGRGGWQEKPIVDNFAFADGTYKTGYIRLNSVFTLLTYYGQKSVQEYNFMEQADAERIFRELTDTEKVMSLPGYPMTNQLKYPVAPSKPYNFVFLIMESWSAPYMASLTPESKRRADFYAQFASAEEGQKVLERLPPDNPFFSGLTPAFDRLAAQGILFTRFYAAGSTSIEGIMAMVSSLQPMRDFELGHSGMIQNRFSTVSGLLKESGYSGLFVTGLFDGSSNNDRIMSLAGIDKIIQKSSFPDADKISDSWGVYDIPSVQRLNEELKAFPTPFFAYYISVTSHTPYQLPEDAPQPIPDFVLNYEFMNEIYYSDKALEVFFEAESKSPHFADTIYIITGDHTNFVKPDHPTDYGHVPFLIYAPHIFRTSQRIDAPAGHADLLPTIAELIGYPRPFSAAGVSLLDREHPRFAYNFGNYFRWFEPNKMLETQRDLSELGRNCDFTAGDCKPLSAEETAYYYKRFRAYYQVINNAIILNRIMPAEK
ncbi:hypothetical protein CHS0354_006820 [Potamilus streckersoni]|uniref:Sulfatase N-terminal domain-containing protein n=1 Tax=Potamilus streckersoni TaxID=2493646 RepID=A0AAE0TF14_9BIVA|nr:hypothetical protein CHS0354_006820 [Potamilus streckersoni]